MIKLIVGLANPGQQYEKTRHNAGAWFINAICDSEGLKLKTETKHKCQLDKMLTPGNNPTYIAIPTTYMNHSGQAVGALAKYYNLKPQEILIAHDELDLEPGQIKLKAGGGHAGHNGLRDIINHLGQSKDFYRLRIGIGHPGHKDKVTPYVLSQPNRQDQTAIDTAIDNSIGMLSELINGDFEAVMQNLHQKTV